MRRPLLFAVAAILALVGAGLFAYSWAQLPTTVRIAVGPIGSEDTRLVAAMAQYLARERASVRLKIVMTESVAGSAEAVDSSKSDLAVVRTDVAMPAKAQTVAILHRDAALLMSVEGSGIESVPDLRGRKIGIVRTAPANATLLETVLAQYEIPADSITMVQLASPAEVEEAFAAKRISAVLAVGTLTGRTVTETVAALAKVGMPSFIPIKEAGAIAQRSPLFESLEAVRGAFGGTPPRPAEPLPTLAVSHRLVADPDLDDGVVSELTRLIFVMRPAIAAEVPIANRIEEPDTSKSSSLPVHTGAAAYYDGEVQTFFERYGDWFYFAIMALSILGSGVAAFASNAAAHSRARNMVLLSELLAIVRTARHVADEAELDRLEASADEILAAALAKAGGGGIDGAGMAAFTLGLDQARRAIAERRQFLATHVELPPLSRAAE